MERYKLLEVRELRVSFFAPQGEIRAVNGVSFDVERGEIVGMVGESGSGKSVSAGAILNLLPPGGRIMGGSVLFDGEDVGSLGRRGLEHLRGGRAAMIFQNPMACLNPVYTIGNQLTEALTIHDRTATRPQAVQRAMDMLDLTGIGDPAHCMRRYPHELSGGMLQRVMIAMALMCEPELLIADEPTTALDVTIEAQILALLNELRKKTGMAVLFITHDLNVVAELCDRVCVMYGGTIVEQGTAAELYQRPEHPYTQGLLRTASAAEKWPRGRLPSIQGAPPDMHNPPESCPFARRCDSCMRICLQHTPPLTELGSEHWSACWLHARDRLWAGQAAGGGTRGE